MKKEYFSISTIMSLFLIMLFSFFAHSAPTIGIYTLDDLKKIGSDPSYPLDGNYSLENDIDASDTHNWPNGFDPIGDEINPFIGNFYGNNHIIANLYIKRHSEDYVGLFSKIGGFGYGMVRELNLVNLEIYGRNYVGGIAGSIGNGSISYCSVSGNISASGQCGGLVGNVVCGPPGSISIYWCYTLGNLRFEDYGGTYLKQYFGGLIGEVVGPPLLSGSNVFLSHNYSQMDILTNIVDMSYLGGLLGSARETVDIWYCYSTGLVPEGIENIGGLIGYINDDVTVNLCVWDMETSQQTTSAGGNGKSTVEMKNSSTFSVMGWDISTTPCTSCSTYWSIYENDTYPFLCEKSILIPDERGKTCSLAEKDIIEKGFNAKIIEVYHNTTPLGIVIETKPEHNCYFPVGDTVTIYCSKGPYPPIPISTIEELQQIGNDPNYPEDNEYYLTNDIDATGTRDWNGGNGFLPINFSGLLDGLGRKISGLYIKNTTGTSTGLFEVINKPTGTLGRVQNLIIEDAVIYGMTNVGILAGEIRAPIPEIIPTIENVVVSGNVFGVNSVGGLAGVIGGGISVWDCSIFASISSWNYPPTKVTYEKFGGICGNAIGCNISRTSFIGAIYLFEAGNYMGGITGYAQEDTSFTPTSITNCYAWAHIGNTNSSIHYMGGLIGFADMNTSVQNSYSASDFTIITLDTGGLIGAGTSPVTVTQSFWDKTISGVSSSYGGGIGETTGNMKKRPTFMGWDFINTWGINEDISYPILRSNLMRIENYRYWYYPEAEEWLASRGITYGTAFECSNIIPEDFIITQSIEPLKWIQVFSPYPLTLTISTGLCPQIPIDNINQIALIGKDPAYPVDGYYILDNNIDASDTKNWNGGAGFEPIQSFQGIFDGNQKLIYGLYINRPNEDNVGLFGLLEDTARVIRTYIKDANITGRNEVGILAGTNIGYDVNMCGVHGVVSGTGNNVGSLIGDNKGIVKDSFGVAGVNGIENVGGLFGNISITLYMDSNEDNYFWGVVSGDNNVGGFIGHNNGSIGSSYSVAKINASKKSTLGGFCAQNTGTIYESYWDKEYSGIEISSGGVGKKTEEMKSESTFSAWDFTTIWMINDGITYPFLRNNLFFEIDNYVRTEYEPLRALFESYGLIINHTERCDWTYNAGIIVEQSLKNVYLPLFANIDFVVSNGICTTVPDVIGDTLIQAINEINSAHLIVGNVTEECSNTYPSGVVFKQSPIGGDIVVRGTSVDLTVSSGPCPEGEGVVEGEGGVEGEGSMEGEGIVEGEGGIEGEGIVEGSIEGTPEGTTEGEMPPHSADQDGNWKINLSELLRVIQFFNSGGYHCEADTEDGYAPGIEGDHSCSYHASDYNLSDWIINLSELLRVIQFFNIGGYHPCPGVGEDDYCPGL